MFKAATIYFAVVFGTGFLLGAVRVLLVVTRFGEQASELIEAPLMLIATFLAARFVKHMFIGRRLVALGIGVVALLLLVLTEITFVIRLRGLSVAEYVRSRDPVSGTVHLVMLMVFAIMPLLLTLQFKSED